ncbi:MAG: 4-alpha-glucanotransferase, partial [Gammaproteobacteria bacterium]
CTAGSHDLPTLKGYWQEADIALRQELDLFPSEEFRQQQLQYRCEEKRQLLKTLKELNLIDEDSSADNYSELFSAIQTFLARSNSLFMMVQLEDILSQTNQINVPGTIDEYPNWRHKNSLNLEDWLTSSELTHFAQTITRERVHS